MPINRLTAFTVLAAALFVVLPAQATASKAHGKTTHAKQTHQKQAPAKLAHRKPVHGHGKLAVATHKAIHSRQAASGTRIADIVVPTAAISVAAIETKPTSGSLPSRSFAMAASPVVAGVAPSWLSHAPATVFSPAGMQLQPTHSTYFGALAPHGDADVATDHVAVSSVSDQDDTDGQAPAAAGTGHVTDLRKSLIALAMNLRDIRYVRGGHDPSTGFDCSGFVRYVFAHAIGLQLPTNSASQFLAGLKVNRADMKPGDLVFFRTHGKRNISHVGIYISDGRFIHSPTSGKSVEISSLNEAYWAKHFAGAKRPEAMEMAMVANKG